MIRSASVDQPKDFDTEVEDVLWEKEKRLGARNAVIAVIRETEESSEIALAEKKDGRERLQDEKVMFMSTSSSEGAEGAEEASGSQGIAGIQERAGASTAGVTEDAGDKSEGQEGGHAGAHSRSSEEESSFGQTVERRGDESIRPRSSLEWYFNEESVEDLVEGATIVEDFLSPVIQAQVDQLPLVFPQLHDNSLSLLCLARLGFSDRFKLRAVSRAWREALCSEALYAARVATEQLEENLVLMFFSSEGPYFRLTSPATGESMKLPPFDFPEHISMESLRLTVAGKMVYLYSTEGRMCPSGADKFILCYDTVRKQWQTCPGLGVTGEYVLAAADWVSGQLLVISNDVSGMLLGNVPDCEQAQVATWDPRTREWDHCSKVPPWLHYCHLTSAASINGRFFLFMIEVVSGSLRAVEYDPLDKTWTPVARFPTAEPQVTSLGGGVYGVASGVVWRLGEEGWEYLANLPRHVNHCRVHNDCDKWCQTISHCEQLLMRLSGMLCSVRTWLSWMQKESRWTVKVLIELLDVDTYPRPPVPLDGWQRLLVNVDDEAGVLASCGVAVT